MESNGSIKIVYQNTAHGPGIIRDIRETNEGIREGKKPATTTATQDLRLQVVPQRKAAAGTRSGKRPEVHKRAGGGGNDHQSDSEESATDPEDDEIFVPTLRYQNGREILDFSNSSPEHTQKKRPSSGPVFDRVDKQRKCEFVVSDCKVDKTLTMISADQPASYNRSHNPLPTPALSMKSSGSGTSQTRSLPPAPSRTSSSTSRPGEGSNASRTSAPGGITESSSLLDLDKILEEREARMKKLLGIERLNQEIKEMERRLQEEGL